MIRRERRQWSLIGAMVATVVAAGVFSVTGAYNLEPANGRIMGNASDVLFLDSNFHGSPDVDVDSIVAAARSEFETVDVVRSWLVTADGSANQIPIRAFDPSGTYTSPLAALVNGRYPAGSDELAGSQRQLDRLGWTVGDSVSLNDQQFELVGVIENPQQLSDEFLFAHPKLDGPPDASVLLYVNAPQEQVHQFGQSVQSVYVEEVESERTVMALATSGLVTLVLLEVGLLASASIMILAQRRVRHLGMLAAVGASARRIRTAVVAGGTLIGLVAGVLGIVVGVVVSVMAIPLLETVADRRIDSVAVPWGLVAGLGVVAVLSSMAAAWWPARTMSKIPPVEALGSRRPKASQSGRLAAVGVTITLAGVIAVIKTGSGDPEVGVVWFVAGIIAIPLGLVMMSPLSIRLLAAAGSRLPLAGALAARDMGRSQSRSAAALAAIVIVLSIPVMIAASTRTFEADASNVPTMDQTQLILEGERLRGPTVALDVEALQPIVDQISEDLNARVAALSEPRFDGQIGMAGGLLVSLTDNSLDMQGIPSYIATPELIDMLGLAPADFAGYDMVMNQPGTYVLMGDLEFDGSQDGIGTPPTVNARVIDFPRYQLTPGALLREEYVESRDMEPFVVGWLLQTDAAITDQQIAMAIDRAGASGLFVTSAEPAFDGTAIRGWALLGGGLVALAVAAMVAAVNHVHEQDTDRMLEALGAKRSFRRKRSAAGLGLLLIGASILAIPSGWLPQVGIAKETVPEGEFITSIPFGSFAVLVIAVPLAGFLLAWLLTGRSTRTLRSPLE